ncbi:alpha-L-fucosidase [Prolixibacteraceae bacterium JC049]|nr:alpha-L-fucosidase [Prolixibacteraceae bacterium JC049]
MIKRKWSLLLLLTVLCCGAIAQPKKYEATWESLDTRPVPEWFGQAKFGIFIHWGPYSVPAFSPAGTYTEWYQFWWQSRSIFGNNKPDKNAIPNFQDKVYGEESSYYDFGKLFKAELYDPTEWAQLFKEAGAKYVILTSKHHDGYTLWPNKQAQDARHFKWNAQEVGPRRDLLAPYMKAIREAGLKAGLYYSLYEWYHPWYQIASDQFVTKHYHPQFKDLVTKYAPDLIYADGEWEKDDSYWKSAELLQWLFNESPCKDYVTVNDRWFNGCRHKHGGYYTTEYMREEMNLPKVWEEIRGLGLSFGYNRDEDLADYATAQELVLMLCDIVSMGGNLCLNVGPASDGKIPVIQQQRLMEIGKWLKVNGEAIYGTTKYRTSWQWSKGNRKFKLRKDGDSYTTADYILHQTVDQQPGKAVKQAFFTQKGNKVFAILPKWPGKTMKITEVDATKVKSVSLLGVQGKLKWKKSGKNIVVTMPTYDPNWKLPTEAYTLKIQL